MYQVSLQQFSGPLDLLLQLVEKKHLEITDLSLAQVTQEYLEFINQSETINPEDLADFLVIAATLLLIKSRSLLPTLELAPEEEDEVLALENRLKMLQFYQAAGQNLKKNFQNEILKIERPSYLEAEPKFSPPPHLTAGELKLQFKQILSELQLEETTNLAEKKIQKTQTLEERIKILLQRITGGSHFRLEDLVCKKDDKIDLILTFLATLHLAKKKIITLKQNNNFGEIWIWNQS